VHEIADGAIPFVTVRRVRSFDEVTTQIRELVLSGRIKPGQKLPSERELCETLSVSRPTLREALRSLETAGIVEIRSGKNGGAYATGPSEATVGDALATFLHFRRASTADLAEFRATFESENAWWAAKRATADEVRTLNDLIATMKRRAQGPHPQWDVVGTLDAEWHETVARATHNRVRIAISLGIRDALLRNLVVLQPGVGVAERTGIPSELDEVTKAIAEHSPEAASAAMRRHVNHWVRMYPQEDQAGPTEASKSRRSHLDGGHPSRRQKPKSKSVPGQTERGG